MEAITYWDDGLSDENNPTIPITPRRQTLAAIECEIERTRLPSQRRGTSHAVITPFSQLPVPQTPRSPRARAATTETDATTDPFVLRPSSRRFTATNKSETEAKTPRADPTSNDLVIPPLQIPVPIATKRSPTIYDIASEDDLKMLLSTRSGTIGCKDVADLEGDKGQDELVVMDESSEASSEEDEEEDQLPEELVDEPHAKRIPSFTPFFGIAFHLLRKFGKFTREDYWIPEKDCQSQNTYADFLVHWRRELRKEKPNFYLALFATIWKDVFVAVLFQFMFALFSLFSPILVNLELGFILDSTQPSYYGYIYAGSLAAAAFISIFSFYRSRWRMFHVGVKLRAILALAIYEKILTKPDYPTGVIINLFASDAQTVSELLTSIMPGIVAPFQIFAIIGILGYFIGWICVMLFATLVYIVVVNYYMTGVIMKYRRRLGALSDERMKYTSEMIEGVRIVKYYAWEDAFEEKLRRAREKELGALRALGFSRSIVFFSLNSAIPFSLLTTFLTYGLTHPTLDLQIAFTIVGFVNLLYGPFLHTGSAVTVLSTLIPSIGRIGLFFQTPTLPSYVESALADETSRPCVQVTDGSFKWAKAEGETLRNINFRVNEGEKLLIIGKVGSGKTSTLEALIGNIPKTQGAVQVIGTMAFLPQTAWIYNGTVRENILFGAKYDAKRYRKVVTVAQLVVDFKSWPNEDLTEMGERGVNLSGGQKQRIAIARSLYVEKDIYIFDDSLSALDPIVQQSLFINGLMRLLRKKIVIFVTNQLHFLAYPNLKIMLLEEGQQKIFGTLAEIQDRDEISTLIEKSGIDFVGAATKKSRAKFASVMPSLKKTEFKQMVETSANKEKGKIIKLEEKSKGLVSWRSYWMYCYRGGLLVTLLTFLYQFLSAGLTLVSAYWLSRWASSVNSTASNSTVNATAPTGTESTAFYIGIYFAFLLTALFFNLFGWIFSFVVFAIRAARTMHSRLLGKLVHATVSFFDITPASRITTRLTSDLFVIDYMLPGLLFQYSNFTFLAIVAISAVFLGAWFVGIVLVALLPVYYIVSLLFKMSYVEAQRIEALSRSPPVAHLQKTIQGIDVIRAFGAQELLGAHQSILVDNSNMDKLIVMLLYSWMAFRIEIIGGFIQVSLFLGLTIVRNYFSYVLNSSLVGIALSFTMGLPIILGTCVNINAEVEGKMIAVERLEEFCDIEQEEYSPNEPHVPLNGWDLEFRNLKFAYKSGPTILNNITFFVRHGEKVGIVGRTGSGKSSLIQALLRILEPQSGSIFLGDVDYQRIPLKQLRTSMAVIPQEPVLFIGTVRYNLDPFDAYADADIWSALEHVEMKEAIEALPEQLAAPVSENGKNFSAGQRQLLCLARALLKNSQIVLLDEATASVDIDTDLILQRMIRYDPSLFSLLNSSSQLNTCTVLTIAHRINTIIDYDKILVLDGGRMLEFDSPYNLVQREDSVFMTMIKATEDTSAALIESVLQKGRAQNQL